jgi:predicted ATPase
MERMMLFSVLTSVGNIPVSSVRQAFLIDNNWNDWFKFETSFNLYVKDEAGVLHEPGTVKIGRLGLLPGTTQGENTRRPRLPQEFDALTSDFFSLGQGENFYETLNELNADLRLAILTGLRDCAFDLHIFDRASAEAVMNESLLRDLDSNRVRYRLHRLAHGDAVLTRFTFKYVLPRPNESIAGPRLTFSVLPYGSPPSNVHVLIGRNGVGKTRCMQGIARAALHDTNTPAETGELVVTDNEPWTFAGVVFVAFSAFDNFELPQELPPGVRAALVGLRIRTPDGSELLTKTPEQLAADFIGSLSNCRRGLKAQRWLGAVNALSSDPLFAEANAASLLSQPDVADEEWTEQVRRFFRRLSSGHAIVLLTVTRLVDLVEEKTLVLLDEPEGHLHPPLLSAFIRALATLLTSRNGVAVIATHSPVVLQEVPRACVWILDRSGLITAAERPTVETFGENVGTLTREVFRFEVTNTGFHELVRNAVEKMQLDYESVLSHFSGQLGMEARAIARSLIAERDARGSQ